MMGKTSSIYTEQQPRDGEVVMHCGHHESKHWHWFICPEVGEFKNTMTGTIIKSRWIIVCNECFCSNVDAAECVRESHVWCGNHPIIKKVVTH